METLSALVLPLILLICSFGILFGRPTLFDAFLEGAREGLNTSLKLIPVFTALCVAVELLKSSGFGALISDIFGGLFCALGLPEEIASFVFLRPISGSAAVTMLNSVFESCGADSYAAFLASVIMGSGDTLVYILSVYYSSVGINKTKYSMFAAVSSALFSLFVCSFVCRRLFFL